MTTDISPHEFSTHRWSSCVVPATVLGSETTAMNKIKSCSRGADTMMGKKAEEKNAKIFSESYSCNEKSKSMT